jgi:prolyl oligopeptidase
VCVAQVPLHSYKYISELQYRAGVHPGQAAPLLIRIEEKAGHGAGLPLSKRIQEQADTIAFMSLALQAKSDFDPAAPAATAEAPAKL